MKLILLTFLIATPALASWPHSSDMQALLKRDCGEFDTVQLGIDVRSGYFERAGIEMAKAVIADLAIQLECERDRVAEMRADKK